ncbi:MAG: hypothetical protein QOK03_1620 [Candidatus Binataceae bacterium]|jgi:hypothetical protein|nr:hypothetical protein [Candidatus Binataceae bacterium]
MVQGEGRLTTRPFMGQQRPDRARHRGAGHILRPAPHCSTRTITLTAAGVLFLERRR